MLKNSKFLIVAGFGVMLLLMVTLITLGLTRMTALHQQMATLNEEHDAKVRLAFKLIGAARQRVIGLHRLALITDPFEWQDELLEIDRLAVTFIQAREKLMARGLRPEENNALSEFAKLAGKGGGIQARVLDLFQQGRDAEARKVLLDEMIPAQTKVIAQLNRFMEVQERLEKQELAVATETFRNAQLVMVVLGSLAILLGILVAVYVVRRTTATERALYQEKERAQVTLDSIGDGVITTDTEGRVTYSNPVAEHLLGQELKEIQGKALRSVFNLVDTFSRKKIEHPAFDGPVDGVVVSHSENMLLIGRDHCEFDIESSAAPIHNVEGDAIGSVLVFRDVTQARELAKQLAWQAAHDQLTGLINRREFDNRLKRLLESMKSEHDQHALLYLDLDQFKLVNDTAGHAAGDDLLRRLTEKLRAVVQGHDTLARLGGDEFGVLLENRPLEDALRIANELRQVVQDFRFAWDGKIFEVGVSIGLVPITWNCGSPASMLSYADAACYAAKDGGRNRVNVYSPEDSNLMQRQNEMQWVTNLSQAFEEKRFHLYSQSIVSLGEGQEHGHHCEVLLRMTSAEGEVVSPGTFLPAAERYGLMPVIDRWVIRTLFGKLKTHLERTGGEKPSRLCSINLSGASLNDDYFPEFLFDQIRLYAIPPEMLCFEVTETVAISNLEGARRFMLELKGAGCQFSLDDFGSGMSSFAYLKDLPVDYLKIDGMFVKNMVTNPVDFAMVEAINRIGHVMGIKTIAEYVEDEAILNMLRTIGVDYAQGYFIGMPSPLEI